MPWLQVNKKRSPGEVAPLPTLAGQTGPTYSGSTLKSKAQTLTHQEAWPCMLEIWQRLWKRPKQNCKSLKMKNSLWKRAHLTGAGPPHPSPSLWEKARRHQGLLQPSPTRASLWKRARERARARKRDTGPGPALPKEKEKARARRGRRAKALEKVLTHRI